MMTRSKGKQCRLWSIQVVNVEDPDIKSAAALVLLAKKYFTADKSIYTEFRMHRIREKWMKLQMKTPDDKGGLTCAHCKQRGLSPWSEHSHMRAVLDHIQEIGAGGDWRDPTNFQVLCDPCNTKKNNIFNDTRQKQQNLRKRQLSA